MKALFLSTYAQYNPHFSVALEIMDELAEEGHEVTLLRCNADLPACETNIYHQAVNCIDCIGARESGLSFISPRVESIPLLRLTAKNRSDLQNLRTEFATLDDLRAYKIDEFDIGEALWSSMATWLRDPFPCPGKHADLVRRYVISTFAVYCSVRNHLKEGGHERLYVFNGRHPTFRAAIAACKQAGVDWYVHEAGPNLRRYSLYENHFGHDWRYVQQLIELAWEQESDVTRKNREAERFYQERRKGNLQTWPSFLTAQKSGALPASWPAGKRIISVFCSSEDELIGFGEMWLMPFYKSQLDGLQRLIASLSSQDHGLHLFLRMHPNLKGLHDDYTSAMRNLAAPFLTVIPPEDKVDTYSLLDNSDSVLTFGSTMGIEAAYWGKPSILAHHSYYKDLGSTYNAVSHEDLLRLIMTPLEPNDRLGALKYGFYFNTCGVEYKHYEAADYFNGTFKGQNFRLPPVLHKVRRLLTDKRTSWLAGPANKVARWYSQIR